MKPYRDKHNLFGLLTILFLLAGLILSPQATIEAQTPSPPPPTETPSPTPTPTVPPPPVELHLTADQAPDPFIEGQEGEMAFTLSAERAPDAICYGIPLDPLDIFFVVDNSSSAGVGEDSNLSLTIRWLKAFITSIKRQPPAGDPPQRTRIGLAASHTITTGTEILWESLTEDYDDLEQRLDELFSGGDTELVQGLQQAILALQQRARPHARQVLVLMLHDRLPLTEAVGEEISKARQAGIDVYLIANSLNQKDDEVVDKDLAYSLVEEDHYLFDPSIEELRRAFVRMTDGSPDALAQNIDLTLIAIPESFGELEVSPAGVIITDTVNWLIPQLTDDEDIELTYRGIVGNQSSIIVQAIYQDCNGDLRAQTFAFPFVTTHVTVTPTPTPTSTPSPTPLPAVTETPSPPPSTGIPPTFPPSENSHPEATPPTLPDIPHPELPSINPEGPIERFIVWIVELIPGLVEILTPLIGAIPVILQWMLVILLIILLLFLLWRFIEMLKKWLKRRKKITPPPEPPTPTPSPSPSPSPPPPPSSPSIPKWIQNLPDNAVLASSGASEVATKTSHPLQDTLIIGIGEAGREVLEQVADGLQARFGPTWPEKNIHLLQIDVEPKGTDLHLQPPRGLQDSQYALLHPDFQEISKSLRSKPSEFTHWEWYQNSLGEGRARGRMALFYDVRDGSNNSQLWKRLDGALQGLTSPAIRIIGTTFDDVSSGMLVDIARLVQLAATGDTNGNVDVQLWLMGPVGHAWSKRLSGRGKIRVSEQHTRTLATLRELERFQRNAPVYFRYVHDAHRQGLFRAIRQHALINKVVLFEPQAMSSADPKDDVPARMADALLALYNSEANRHWDGHLAGTNLAMGELANEQGQGAVLAIGSYALRYPQRLLAEAVAWRMVRDVLFESAVGLHPIEQVEITNGSYQKLSDSSSIPHFNREAVETLLRDKDLKTAVREQINKYLNGEDASNPFVERRTGITKAIRWLKHLRKILLQRGNGDAARQIKALEDDLINWQQWLESKVYPICKDHFTTTRQKLERLRQQQARQWSIDATLEWEIYRQHVRPWKKEPTNNTQQAKPLLRLAARFGWEVSIDDETDTWKLRLIVPPGDFNEHLDARSLRHLYPYTVLQDDPESFLQGLFEIALRLSQWDTQKSLPEIALKEEPSKWLQRAEPLLRYNSTMATQIMRQVDHLTLLIAPESAEHTLKLKEKLHNVPDRPGRIELCQTSDPTSVTVIRATSWLPLTTLYLYDEEVWDSFMPPPEAYVWRAEQIAAAMETQQRMSALLRSFIAENPDLLRAFGIAFIYGCIEKDTYGWRIPGMDENFASIPEALRTIFEDRQAQKSRIDILRAAAERSRREIREIRSYLRRVEQTRITLLENESQDAGLIHLAHDLAIYLRGLIAEERDRQ